MLSFQGEACQVMMIDKYHLLQKRATFFAMIVIVHNAPFYLRKFNARRANIDTLLNG